MVQSRSRVFLVEYFNIKHKYNNMAKLLNVQPPAKVKIAPNTKVVVTTGY